MPQLSNAVLITKIKDATSAAGSTVLESSVLDMAGYEGVLLFTSYGTAAADNLLKAKMSSANDSAAMGDIEGSAIAPGASDEDQWIDIYRPRKRYVQLAAVRATSTKLGDMWAIQYGPRVKPTDNNTAGTIAGEALVSPSTGTA